MIEFRRACQFDTRLSVPVAVDPRQIESIRECVVGERSRGTLLRMRSGDEIRLWDDYHAVSRAVGEFLQETM